MANARKLNVIFVDTSAGFSDQLEICAVKYIGASGGTATIKDESSSGTVIWEESGDANATDQLPIRAQKGVYVTVGSGAKVYLYLKV